MKILSLPLTAFALAGSMALTPSVQAAPTYTPVDCMQPDGGPSGCWRNGRDYGPYGQSYQTPRYDRDYRGFFDDRSPAKANLKGAQYYGAGR
ncbi:MAG TPA: hypothetical protein VG271_15495 [Beijerinckiaceae bacterium]|jgi:hypothetical protein|nr:hypothetical protein [Beijerinckiaceae bacterium]